MRLACAAAPLLRPANIKTTAVAAAAITAAPAIAPRLVTVLRIPTQVIEPKRLYHAKMVNGKLLPAKPSEKRTFSNSARLSNDRCAGCGADSVMLPHMIFGSRRGKSGPASAMNRGPTRLTLE